MEDHKALQSIESPGHLFIRFKEQETLHFDFNDLDWRIYLNIPLKLPRWTVFVSDISLFGQHKPCWPCLRVVWDMHLLSSIPALRQLTPVNLISITQTLALFLFRPSVGHWGSWGSTLLPRVFLPSRPLHGWQWSLPLTMGISPI